MDRTWTEHEQNIGLVVYHRGLPVHMLNIFFLINIFNFNKINIIILNINLISVLYVIHPNPPLRQFWGSPIFFGVTCLLMRNHCTRRIILPGIHNITVNYKTSQIRICSKFFLFSTPFPHLFQAISGITCNNVYKLGLIIKLLNSVMHRWTHN